MSRTMRLPANVSDDPVLADDGYPSELELQRVRSWPIKDWSDCRPLMDYVEARWSYRKGAWERQQRRVRAWRTGPLEWRYRVSTVGWSGNESLLAALQENTLWWMKCWEAERRGGHYEFRVPA